MEQIPSNTPVMETKPGVAGWFAVWMKAVSKPSEQSFIDITESSEATTRTALIWVFIAGTITGLVTGLVQALNAFLGSTPQFPPIPGLEQYVDPSLLQQGSSPMMTLVFGICGAPVAGLLTVAFFALGVAIVQWVAKLFKGTGSFEKLAYAYAAITMPVSLVSAVLTVLGAIPFIGACFGFVSLAVTIYTVVLQVYAVKAVNRFPTFGPAVGSVFIPSAVIFFVLCLCAIAFSAIFGAAIGQGFAP